jgi:hypothetical protein
MRVDLAADRFEMLSANKRKRFAESLVKGRLNGRTASFL